MKKVFKKGDIVIMNKEKITLNSMTLPKWYSDETFQIVEVLDRTDSYGFPIVKLNKNLIKSNHDNLITSFFLIKDIKAERKKKLKQL